MSGFQPSRIRRNMAGSPSSNANKISVPSRAPDVDEIFHKVGANDRALILDKIHHMRMKAFDKRGYENLAKPHMPSFNEQEKEKITEQYHMAKRQMKGLSPREIEITSHTQQQRELSYIDRDFWASS